MSVKFSGRVIITGRNAMGYLGDTTAPVISVISSGTPNATNATITWTTDEAATSVVDYGLTAGYGSTQSDASLVTSHSVTIVGLSPSTTYHFQVTSVDAFSNSSSSADGTLATAASGVASNPSCGLTNVTVNRPPDTRYQSYIANISTDGTTVTVQTTAAHDFLNNDTLKISGTTNYNSAKGVYETINSVADNTHFTYLKTGALATETAGFVTWNPAPTAGSTYVDPVFGCTVKRLGDYETTEALLSPIYSTFMQADPSNTYVFGITTSDGKYRLMNLSNWSIYKTPAQFALNTGGGSLSSTNNPRWLSSTEVIFNRSLILYKKNVVTDVVTQLHDFGADGCSGNLFTGNTGDLDESRDSIAYRCGNPTGGFDFFTYRISTDTSGRPSGAYHSTAASDFPFMGDDGTFFIFWGGTPGVQQFNGTTGALIQTVLPFSPHGRPMKDGSGNILLVFEDTANGISSPYACGGTIQGIASINVATLTKTCILANANLGRVTHFSTSSSIGPNPDWVTFEIKRSSSTSTAAYVQNLPTNYISAWQLNYNQVMTCKVDGSSCYILAHLYSRGGGVYERQPFAHMTPDGKYVFWRAGWGICDNNSPACSNSNASWNETAVIQIRS